MRAELIETRLTTLFRDQLSQSVAMVSQDEWARMPVAPRFRFGYMPPVPVTHEGDTFVVALSPELLDRVTRDLDEEGLDTYLTAVETFLLGHIKDDRVSSDEVMRSVEDLLLEQAPKSLSFMTAVELQAIDDGIVDRLN